MRLALLYNPRLLCERVAQLSHARRRLASLRGTVARNLTLGHIESLELLNLLRPLEIKTIYDIGANVGTWTLLAKALYPQAEVHAFEPLPLHHSVFAREAGSLDGVFLHKVALGESDGVASMRVTDFSDASSILPLTEAGRRQWNISELAQEQVRMERLDGYRQKAQLPAPSLIKLDVQGFELNVLRGAERCLEESCAVLTEVSFREFYEAQCAFEDVVTFLAEHEFTLFALGQGTTTGLPLSQADALFVAKRFLDRLSN